MYEMSVQFAAFVIIGIVFYLISNAKKEFGESFRPKKKKNPEDKPSETGE